MTYADAALPSCWPRPPWRRSERAPFAVGHVVAAPVFALENANAPGGHNEADLANQPADVSFVITRLPEASQAASGPLSGLIDRRQVTVAGHSDGGDTALAVAWDPRHRDARVWAAVILSGAESRVRPRWHSHQAARR